MARQGMLRMGFDWFRSHATKSRPFPSGSRISHTMACGRATSSCRSASSMVRAVKTRARKDCRIAVRSSRESAWSSMTRIERPSRVGSTADGLRAASAVMPAILASTLWDVYLYGAPAGKTFAHSTGRISRLGGAALLQIRERVGVSQVGGDRGHHHACLDGDELDPDQGHPDPRVDDDPLVE